jgi:hypothetical protein
VGQIVNLPEQRQVNNLPHKYRQVNNLPHKYRQVNNLPYKYRQVNNLPHKYRQVNNLPHGLQNRKNSKGIVMKAQGIVCLVVLLATMVTVAGRAENTSTTPETKKYTLRYHFHPGETLRWKVGHQCEIRTTVAGSTQTAETITNSVKVWRVSKVQPDGTAVLEHMVESVDMRHKLSGRDEVHYNSDSREPQPAGFQNVADAVGVPLSTVTLNSRGKVLDRKQHEVKAAVPGEGELTIVLPDEPVAIGQEWSYPNEIELPQPGGAVRRIKSVQAYTLEGVKTGVATIRVVTKILSPVNDPAVEAQLIQFMTAGTVRVDIEAGRILSQQMDVDKGVVGFRGEASNIHYRTRFGEEFQPSGS